MRILRQVAVFFVFMSIFCVPGQGTAERLPGDLNGDGQVNFADFTLFAQQFGKTGGEVFDPNIPDTVIVRDTTVVRDTIRHEVRVPGPVRTVYDTIYASKLFSSITVEPGQMWSRYYPFIQVLCETVRDVLAEPLVFPLDSDIFIQYHEQGPKILYRRTQNGSHVIWLDIRPSGYLDFIQWRSAQTIFQFSHEYSHVIANHYQTYAGTNDWFGEAIACMGSLYVLRELDRKIKKGFEINVYVPSANTTYFISNSLNSGLLLEYAEINIPGHRMTLGYFREWFGFRLDKLSTYMPAIQGYNKEIYDDYNMIARNLIHIFEENPEAWNAVRYLDIHGPVSWDSNQNFSEYLRGWYLRTPARWQKYVQQIANRFGYSPANKPVFLSNEIGDEDGVFGVPGISNLIPIPVGKRTHANDFDP